MQLYYMIISILLIMSCSNSQLKLENDDRASKFSIEDTTTSFTEVLDTLVVKGCFGYTIWGHLDSDYLFVIRGNQSDVSLQRKECSYADTCGISIIVEKKKKGVHYSNPCSDIVFVNSPEPDLVEILDFELTYWIQSENNLDYFHCRIDRLILNNGKRFDNLLLDKVSITERAG